MERSEAEKPASEDGSQLNRNRSFKSKQLVRSQAIRESTSPPRTISPAYADVEITANVADTVNNGTVNNGTVDRSKDDSSVASCDGEEIKKQPVEIQITGGTWDDTSSHRQRTAWLQQRHHSESLLSKNPRVACVCAPATHCTHCRGRRRRNVCPIKQDSGIACSDDCSDCAESDGTGCTESLRKSESLDVDEQSYYCRCPERREKPKNITLSRTDSDERSEPTGPELVNFIKETLNKNARDRMTLLKIEKELHALVNDTGRCIVRFPVMTSYGRMLVHRCASLFQLSHHLDQTNKTSVLVSKSGTSGGRIPCTSFKQWCTAAFPPSPQRHAPDATHAKSILKRDTNSLDETSNGSLANSRSKSLEQRERDYERMKRRIFSTDNCTQSQDESQWPWLGAPVKLLTPETGRNKLLKVQSLESSSGLPPRGGGRRGVSKSHSFGGYAQPPPATNKPLRLLSRQGDLASSSWRLSPSSSGYKTLSLRSTDSVTPSPTGGASPEPCFGAPPPGGCVVWCVTDMSLVPPGAWLLHPQTGRPLSNPDGSVYRFDPDNPPVLDQNYPQEDTQIDQSEKKRGKLEKQHSFIDHGECDCNSTEETRSKCCCDSSRHDPCQQNTEKNPSNEKQDPQSPRKNRTDPESNPKTYETPDTQKPPEVHTKFEPTIQNQSYNTSTHDVSYENYEYEQKQFEINHRTQYEATTNHRAPFEAVANQKPVYEAPANQRPHQFEAANQRAQIEMASKSTNQESQEIHYNQYGQAVRTDELTSPQQHQNPYQQPETPLHALTQVKTTPVSMPDPNIRPMSLNNVVYPTMQQGYPYMNQCRMDQPIQQMYQQPVLPPPEDQKQMTTSPHQEPTFRIDPSYPYAAIDYAAQCGACVDPNAMRSYNMPYTQVEMPQTVIPPTYPVGNMLLPQAHIQPYPYQEPMQWAGGALLPLCRPLYQCGLVYPPVLPQPYPVCNVYPAPEQRDNSRLPAAPPRRQTPQPQQINTTNASPVTRRNSDEIAVKIQQIKEQMAELNTREKERGGYNNKGREEWRKRNNGSGILGSYPHSNSFQGRTRFEGRPANDETQLSSAARAIVNSIRNMQAKSTNNYHDNRRDYRPDYRRRERECDKDREKETKEESERRDRRNPADRQMQYRPPYLLRQMSPGTWCRRSPGPVHPVLNHPRRPHPDTRNPRR